MSFPSGNPAAEPGGRSPDRPPGSRDGSPSAPWDRALGFALTGSDHPDWAETEAPEPGRLMRLLAAIRFDAGGLRRHRVECRRQGRPWPHPVPADLRTGIGAAQFAAALRDLVADLDLDRSVTPVLSDRRPDADELRLLRDVPPHHGV